MSNSPTTPRTPTFSPTSSFNTIESVFDDKAGREYLKQFLQTEHNLRKCTSPTTSQVNSFCRAEPLLFVEQVEEYFALKSPFNRYNKAKQIVELFFTITSKNDLNLSQQTRASVIKTFDECNLNYCPRDIFDECLATIMLEIKEDIWPRFSKSNEMKEYCFKTMMNGSQMSSDETSESENEMHQVFSKKNKFITSEEFEVSKQWCLQDNIDGVKWKVTKKDKDCTAFISGKAMKMDQSSRRSIKMWKLESVLPFSVETVVAVQTSVDILLNSDPNQVESYQMDYLISSDETNASTIIYDRVTFPLMIASRSMTSAVAIKLELTDQGFKRYILLRKAVSVSDTPKKKGVVHGDLILCKVFEQGNADNTETKFYECGWLDLKGSVPLLIWNKMVGLRGTKLHNNIVKSCQLYLEESQTDSNKYSNTLGIMDTLKYNNESDSLSC